LYQTGNSTVTAIRNKGLKVSGAYTLYFNSTTDRNAYYNLNKRAMALTMTGNANESMVVHIPRFRLQENDISTGLDDFYVSTGDWVAEDVVDNGVRLVDVVLNNSKSGVY
jgi:hypothetical protein